MMISRGSKTHSWVSQKRRRYDVNDDLLDSMNARVEFCARIVVQNRVMSMRFA